jgi:hypothetical protein
VCVCVFVCSSAIASCIFVFELLISHAFVCVCVCVCHRRGELNLAQKHISHAAVVFERAVGPFAADTVRCLTESVRLSLRRLMGGRWGFELPVSSHAGNHHYDKSSIRNSGSRTTSSSSNSSSAVAVEVKPKRGSAAAAVPVAEEMSEGFVMDALTSLRSQMHRVSRSSHSINNSNAEVGMALPNIGKMMISLDDQTKQARPQTSSLDQSDSIPDRGAETMRVNQAAIDVSRRLDKLATTDPDSADKFSRKCSNLIAMAELLAAKERTKLAVLKREASEGKWQVKRSSKLPQSLSDILSRRLSDKIADKRSTIEVDSSYWIATKSAVSDVAGVGAESAEVHAERSHAGGAVASGESLEIPSQASSYSIDDSIARAMLGVDVASKLNKSLKPVKRKQKQNRANSFDVTIQKQVVAGAPKKSLLKLPRFSKNTFDRKSHPNYGLGSGEWSESFFQAEESVFASVTDNYKIIPPCLSATTAGKDKETRGATLAVALNHPAPAGPQQRVLSSAPY